MLWKSNHEEHPEYVCKCGFSMLDADESQPGWIRKHAKQLHYHRHKVFSRGVKLGKSFPLGRVGEDNIIAVDGYETGYASRVVYYLARAFNRYAGFDFVMWPYMGDYPMDGPGHTAYLYVEDGHAIGVLLGHTGLTFDTGERIPAAVRLIFVAADHHRHGIGTALSERFARDAGVGAAELCWEAPLTASGRDLGRHVSGDEARVI